MISTSQTISGDERELELTASRQLATVLLIHSDAPRNDEFVRELASHEMRVVAAPDREAGLNLLGDEVIDAVILEIGSPGASDLNLLINLKEDSRTIDVPVLVLSAQVSTAVKVRAFELGAVDYIIRPVDIAELRARLRSVVRLRRVIQMLGQRAQIDGLTGLFNRAHFDHRLSQEVAESIRFGSKLSLVMCDLDRFKSVNDTFGHPFGDRVLETFARILNSGRMSDIACRYGGEEFAVILPRAGAAEAAGVAERFREALELVTWDELPARAHHRDGAHAAALHLSASFGVADMDRTMDLTGHALVCAADAALYKAKRSGRNRVCIAPDRE